MSLNHRATNHPTPQALQTNIQTGQKKGVWHTLRVRITWPRMFILAALLGLSACNALTASYNNAPTLLTWWADRYLDLDHDQEALLKDRLRNLRAWHRTQLPDYARLFADLQSRIGRQVEPNDVSWLFDESEKRVRLLAQRAAPAAAELATHLRPDNIAALEKKLAKNNADFEKDYITAPLDERQDKRYERVLAEAERWYGSFSSEQKRKIRALSNALPANYPLVLEDRKRRHAELVATLKGAVDKSLPQDEVARRLSHWATDFEQGRAPGYRDFGITYKAETQKMLAAIANLASGDQRQVADKNVQKYMDDINNLALASN